MKEKYIVILWDYLINILYKITAKKNNLLQGNQSEDIEKSIKSVKAKITSWDPKTEACFEFTRRFLIPE